MKSISEHHSAVCNYGWAGAADPHSCAYIAPAVFKRLRQLRVNKVLDLGAGNGRLCGDLSGAGFRVVGVEVDAAGVDAARIAFPAITFYHQGVEADPHEVLQNEGECEAVVSTEVIEHLYAPHRLPAYARSLLKPGGYLPVTTPYHGDLKNLALAVSGRWDKHFTALWHGGHIKFWSRATLTELLEQNGFRVVSFAGVGRARYFWKSMVMAAVKA